MSFVRFSGDLFLRNVRTSVLVGMVPERSSRTRLKNSASSLDGAVAPWDLAAIRRSIDWCKCSAVHPERVVCKRQIKIKARTAFSYDDDALAWLQQASRRIIYFRLPFSRGVRLPALSELLPWELSRVWPDIFPDLSRNLPGNLHSKT